MFIAHNFKISWTTFQPDGTVEERCAGFFVKRDWRAHPIGPCAEGSRTWSDFKCSTRAKFICEGFPDHDAFSIEEY